MHITKVMLLCAVVRPCFNPCSNSWWDSKLGIWPIGDWELAKWKLKNRPKGMLVWENKLGSLSGSTHFQAHAIHLGEMA